jgi:hypothetical protein
MQVPSAREVPQGGSVLAVAEDVLDGGGARPLERQRWQSFGRRPGPDPGRGLPAGYAYLLNPAGIVVLVTLSAEASSIAVLAVGVLAAVLAFDIVVVRWAVQVSSKLDASRMLVTEKVFGFLLAALEVQPVLNGPSDVGVIHLTTGH